MKLSDDQREALIRRIARELAWSDATEYGRSEARRRAIIAVNTLDVCAHHGATLKRGADKLIHPLPDASDEKSA